MADGEPSNPPAEEKDKKEVKEGEKEKEEQKGDQKAEEASTEIAAKEEGKTETDKKEEENEKEVKSEETKEEEKQEAKGEDETTEDKEAIKGDEKEDGEKPTEVTTTGDKPPPDFKIGDWYCQSCGIHNFARRNQCMACHHYKMTQPAIPKSTYRNPYGRVPGKVGREAGDWECPNCCNLNFARRTSCKWCYQSPNKFMRTPPFPFQYPSPGHNFTHPSSGYYGGYRQMGPYGGPGQSMYPWAPFDMMQQMPPQFHQYGSGYNMYQYPQGNRQWAANDPQSDWDCWVCGNLNYAKRSKCKSCETEREKALPRSGGGVPRPGDWFCMSCQNVNFSKRHECKICNSPRSTSSNELVLQRLRGSQAPF